MSRFQLNLRADVQREGLEELHEILVACGLDMQERLGLSHWVPAFSLEGLAAQAALGGVYSVRDDDGLVGTFTVSPQPLSEYPGVEFAADGEPSLHLHRVAIHPDHQGRGVGVWAMREVERLARKRGCRSVRFDAFSQNEGLLDFYRRLGYMERGRVVTRQKLVVCFEKVIASP